MSKFYGHEKFRHNHLAHIKKDFLTNKKVYMMAIPMLAFYVIFCYVPIYGALVAFQNYRATLGIWGSPWVGFKHFSDFFNSFYFGRLLRNTILINAYSILFGFPAPILLALLLNELRNIKYKQITQTVSYIPHFISLVVLCGIIRDFTASTGLINDIISVFGGTRKTMLQEPAYFRSLYVITGIWSNIGWGSIIYLAALSGVEQELYESARIDGANKFMQMIHVTIPGILPTIIIMFILRIGSILSLGSEKILLLYNNSIYETADVISTYVYRKGIAGGEISYSTAIGLFESFINLTFIVGANKLSRKFSEYSLW